MREVLFADRNGQTPLSEEEKEGLKYDHITTMGELDEVERNSISKSLIWLRTANKAHVLSLDFSKVLHKRMFDDVWKWAGRFRQTNKNIGVDKTIVSSEMKNLMDDALYWKEKKTYSAMEAGARFHHRLTRIHPFPNGNGRYSRIHTNLLFDLLGQERPRWAIEMNPKKRRSLYICALRNADQQDYGSLIEFLKG